MNRGRRGLPLAPVLLALILTVALPALARGQGDRPDIVVIYLDDVAPHDGRLWNDPARTPTLAQLFAQRGISFSNAISETPLCSPGRAGLLTGRHTVNHHIDANIVAPFDPSVTLGTELQETGYRTAYIGKYLNALGAVPAEEMERYATGWDVFDVIHADNGRFYNYDLWTRDGIERHDRDGDDHSTDVAREHVTQALRETPDGTPVMALVSVFDLHAPNRSPERFDGDPRCADIEAWKPPNFAEADVSDKPAYVQALKPIRRDGWPMRRFCEEMLAVDELVASVVQVQTERGRLDDTLFILTSDNGNTWGAHNLPARKATPYSTPVPLVMTWTNRWGDEPRVVDEIVSNIDMAPTLCAIAGCEMGPFVSGPPEADGLSFLPLLDGEIDHLDRTVVREQSGPGFPSLPESWSIRTTSQHPQGHWHYTEYETGERELYDSVADPWELDNLASDPARTQTLAELAADLRTEFPDLPTVQQGSAPASPAISADASA